MTEELKGARKTLENSLKELENSLNEVEALKRKIERLEEENKRFVSIEKKKTYTAWPRCGVQFLHGNFCFDCAFLKLAQKV